MLDRWKPSVIKITNGFAGDLIALVVEREVERKLNAEARRKGRVVKTVVQSNKLIVSE